MLSIQTLTIEGITETVILNYFTYLNSGDFAATADLFAPDGILQAPFEPPLIGREAIVNYLTTEAQGLALYPQKGTVSTTEDDSTQIYVTGRVKTPLLGVNVSWRFLLTSTQEIAFAEIKLLASLKELIHLQK